MAVTSVASLRLSVLVVSLAAENDRLSPPSVAPEKNGPVICCCSMRSRTSSSAKGMVLTGSTVRDSKNSVDSRARAIRGNSTLSVATSFEYQSIAPP